MLLALTPDAGGAAPGSTRPSAASLERVVYEAIQHGDERQAGRVYASLLPAVQATLWRVLGCPDRNHRELTRRSIEQVILELARHTEPTQCRLEVWATASAARVALDALRARAGSSEASASWGDAMAQPPVAGAGDASNGAGIDRLRWLLAELPRQQAEAVVLCDVMGLDVLDAALALRLGVEHLGRLLAAGHERLARQMALA